MAKKKNVLDEDIQNGVDVNAVFPEETTEDVPAVLVSNAPKAANFNSFAYMMFEDEGNVFKVVRVPVDTSNFVSGKPEVIEENTDKYIIQERLQILLLSDDMA